jgi:hypothetical protein
MGCHGSSAPEAAKNETANEHPGRAVTDALDLPELVLRAGRKPVIYLD